MQFEPTSEQASFINRAIASGRFKAPEEAINDALNMWLARERARMEIMMSVKAAQADIAAGRYTAYTHAELPKMAEDIKRKAREQRAES